MSTLLQDFRSGLRLLWRQPGLCAIVIITLALAIGANTAIYSVFHHALLSPPQYADPDRLVAVWGVMPTRDIDEWPASPAHIAAYQEQAGLFEDFAGLIGGNQVFRIPGGEPEQVAIVGMTWNTFGLLGVRPLVGRDFDASDAVFNPDEVPPGFAPPNDVFNPPSAVILSHEFWQTRFGGDPGVIGRVIELNDVPAEVVGVMPEGFRFLMHGGVPANPGLYAAMRVDTANAPLVNVFMPVVARMKPGITIAQAQAEMEAIAVRLYEREPLLEATGWTNRVVPLREELVRDIRAVVFMLGAAVALVLLIASVNVTNLLLVRAAGQGRDAAIRSAMGCGRWRQMQRCLVETAVLTSAGAALGLWLASLSLPVLIALQPDNLPQLANAGIDRAVLGYTLIVTVLVTLIAGTLPALTLTRHNPADFLKDRGAGGDTSSSGRWRNALVVSEVALAFTVLIAAGLMVRSFADLTARNPGFDPAGALTFTYALPNARYPSPDDILAFHGEFQRRVAALPGVNAVGGSVPLPLTGAQFGSRYSPELATFLDGSARQAQYRFVMPGFFEAVGATLVAGRGFTLADHEQARPYVVVNEALAVRAWPGESPLGRRLYIRGATPDPVELEVIGMTRHMANTRLDEEPLEALYIVQGLASEIGFIGGTNWIVRTGADPLALVGPIQAELAQMDPAIPLVQVDTLEDIVKASAAPTRFAMTLISIFAGLALLLAVVGLYGVLAYRVRQRRPELAVRMTLGARRSGVFRLVVRQGMLLVVLGLAVGVLAALASSRFLTGLLVGVMPHDPVTFFAICALFVLVALLACAVPAWRAIRIDPVVALRYE